MVNTGAPDFQGFAQWADDPLFSGTPTGTAAGTVLGTFNVSQWLGLQCLVQNPLLRCTLNFTWFADPGLTIQVGQRTVTFDAFPASPVTMMMPNMGLYVRITLLTPSTQAGVATIVIVPTNRVGPSFATQSDSNLLEVVGLAVGATSVVTSPFRYTYAGPVSFYMTGMGATGDVQIQGTDSIGANHRIFVFGLPQPAGALIVTGFYVPPIALFARFNNATAAGVTVSMTVVPDAWRVGS